MIATDSTGTSSILEFAVEFAASVDPTATAEEPFTFEDDGLQEFMEDSESVSVDDLGTEDAQTAWPPGLVF